MSVKSLQITSSHTGKTVATPASNRADCHVIRHAIHNPHPPPHLDKTRWKTTSPHQSPQSHPALHRHNLTEELLAELFTVSQPTISRAINTIEKALEQVLTALIQPLKESPQTPGSLVIDGTLIPTWNWRS
ncbi:transposase family protein [Rothia sp. ZJ1223]|uniref:helix-turn-helix domain-containing protein n=1 Tax=Rothia sp. ZJ1223 TaxID=2811098 RepID=UPI00195B7D01|nr:transposase family protein [Rothia sp. ZJ1223]